MTTASATAFVPLPSTPSLPRECNLTKFRRPCSFDLWQAWTMNIFGLFSSPGQSVQLNAYFRSFSRTGSWSTPRTQPSWPWDKMQTTRLAYWCQMFDLAISSTTIFSLPLVKSSQTSTSKPRDENVFFKRSRSASVPSRVSISPY